MRHAILGAGGIGGLLGAALARAGADVVLLVRPEALHASLPLLVGPFASDQFAGAEDVRRAGVGDTFDPNHAAPAEITLRAHAVLRGSAPARAATLGNALRNRPGPDLAARLLWKLAKPVSANGRDRQASLVVEAHLSHSHRDRRRAAQWPTT